MGSQETVRGANPARARVLVVDDEANLVELVQKYLQLEGFAVLTAADGLTALEIVRSARPDLIVLDLLLPGLDGIEVCRRLRTFSDAYVLMLTARAEEIDKIIGLSVGADDYLTKPFSPRELVARVKAMLRRPRAGAAGAAPPAAPAPLIFDDLVIDPAAHAVSRDDMPIRLTPREYDLLWTLAGYPGRVFTRDQLLTQVWGDAYYDEHVVDVHVNNLRKKLDDDAAHPRYIETVRGVGYRFLGTRRQAQEDGGRV
ncbi:MAG TPA: response regulator transcription factor [Chloroflexia bacterium]